MVTANQRAEKQSAPVDFAQSAEILSASLRAIHQAAIPVVLSVLWAVVLLLALPVSAGAADAAAGSQDSGSATQRQSWIGFAIADRQMAATWSNFAPSGWVVVVPMTVSVRVDSPDGLNPGAASYAISTDGGNNWSAWSNTGLSWDSPVSTTVAITVTALSLPDSVAGNRIRFQIDEAGGLPQISPDYDVPVDTSFPTSVVTNPAAGAFLNMAPAIRGSATDPNGSGVSGVAISVLASATGLYWDGATWVSGERWLAAAGTTTWSYNGPQPAWSDGASYFIRSRAGDVAGNVETPAASVTFTFDVTPPTVTVLVPNGGELWAGGRAYTTTWTASDTLGLGAQPITLSVSYNAGATWAVLAAAMANTGSFPWTPPLTDTLQALLRIEAVDRAGNLGADQSDILFKIVSSSPAAPQNLQVTPPGWSNASLLFLNWTNPSHPAPIIGAWYKLDLPPVASNDGSFVYTNQILAINAPDTDGVHPVYVWLQDSLGHADYTQPATTTLRLDRVAPSPPYALQGAPARTWTNVNSFAENWTNPLDVSGIVGAYYRLDQPGTFPTDGTFVSTTTTLSNIQVPGDGKHDLYLWLADAAGNTDHNNRNVDPQVFWYDGTPPTSTVTMTPALSASGWYSVPVALSFSALDATGGSGVAAVMNQLDSTGWSTLPYLQVNTQGTHTVSYYARDVAGNMEPTRTLTVSLDFMPPSVTLTPDRGPQASGWYTAPVTLTLAVTDTISGSAGGYYRLNGGAWQSVSPFQIAADGAYQIEYYAQDLASNRTAIYASQVNVDANPPTTAYLIEGSQGQSGWYTSTLTIRLITNDAGSSVAATYYRINNGAWQTGTQFQLAADGIYTLSFYSVDLAGNVETSFPVQVKIDTSSPGSPIAPETSPSAWSRTNRFSIQWANPTDFSGIAGVYYRLGQEPAAPEDGTFSSMTNRLDNLTVPAEGAHRLYLWLRDMAGNADHRNRTVAPLLRYDATPPTTTLGIQGVAGTAGWYRSALTLTLDSFDGLSGVAGTRYRLDSGAWITGTSLVVTSPDKHVLEYTGEDAAGNVETTQQATLRIDPNPPPAPINLRAEPAGWQRTNAFRLLWQDPLDQSGIAGAYLRFDSAPSGPSDGVFHPASGLLENVMAPSEGKHDVYVWLRDGAGNSDQGAAVALTSALWYDGTPPVTTITVTGQAGQTGWYVGPLTFQVSATDAASGLAEIRWQLDDAPWTAITGTSGSFAVNLEGQHVVRIASQDAAGNLEQAHIYPIGIDQRPPEVRMAALSRYQSTSRFDVAWTGLDPIPGSGLASMEIQVRDGWTGAWQNWLVGTLAESAVFSGQRGHTYFFRGRGQDQAGNLGEYSSTMTYAVVETVRNGDFNTGTFSEWETGGLLRKAVVPTDGPEGTTVLSARLGTPEYGASVEEPGQVPVGNAAITQTVTIPTLNNVARPTLSFWYRVFSYDVVFSQRLQRYVDDLEVSIYDTSGQLLVLLLRDGNWSNEYGTLHDTGWRWVFMDLSAYAGQTIQLVFANHNREDNLFNTWSFVDDIQIQDWPYGYRAYMPIVRGPGQSSSAAPTGTDSTAPGGNSVEERREKIIGGAGAFPSKTDDSLSILRDKR